MTVELPEPDPADAELVAYLDGELDPTAAARVEAQLAADPAFRKKAAAFRKSFALLDFLPRPEPSPTFVSRTLDRLPAAPTVAGSGSQAVPVTRPDRARWWAAGTVAAAGLAATVGYLLAAVIGGRPTPASPEAETLTLADARVVENLPLYAPADDIHFVDRLAAPEFFADDLRPAGLPAPADQPTGKALDALAAAFRALPPDRREAVRRLDREVHEQEPARRDKLLRVLETYAAWLHRLPPADRGRVLAAPTAEKRLDAVRVARRAEWVAGLSAARRDQLRPLPPADRDALLARWQAEEARQRDLWRARHVQFDAGRAANPPWPFDDEAARKEVVAFARSAYRPDDPARSRLTPAEQERLLEALDLGEQLHDWGRLGRVVADLGRKYELLPEPAGGKPVVGLDQLPPGVQTFYNNHPFPRKRLEGKAGKWPEFALQVAEDDENLKRLNLPAGFRLGPNRPDEFPPAVRRFLPELRTWSTAAEWKTLAELEGKWPAYPRELIRLARLHDLSVPGVMVPGPPSKWEKFYPPAKAK